MTEWKLRIDKDLLRLVRMIEATRFRCERPSEQRGTITIRLVGNGSFKRLRSLLLKAGYTEFSIALEMTASSDRLGLEREMTFTISHDGILHDRGAAFTAWVHRRYPSLALHDWQRVIARIILEKNHGDGKSTLIRLLHEYDLSRGD